MSEGVNIGSIRGSVDVDTKQAIAGLKNVANQAKQSAAQLKQAQDASKQASLSLKGMNASLGTVDKSLKGVNDLLGGTASQAGKAVGGIGKLSSALAGGVVGVALAASIGAATFAWAKYKEQQEAAEKITKDFTSNIKKQSEALELIRLKMTLIGKSTKDASKAMIDFQTQSQIAAVQSSDSYIKQTQKAIELREKADKEMRRWGGVTEDYYEYIAEAEKLEATLQKQIDAIRETGKASKELIDAEDKAANIRAYNAKRHAEDARAEAERVARLRKEYEALGAAHAKMLSDREAKMFANFEEGAKAAKEFSAANQTANQKMHDLINGTTKQQLEMRALNAEIEEFRRLGLEASKIDIYKKMREGQIKAANTTKSTAKTWQDMLKEGAPGIAASFVGNPGDLQGMASGLAGLIGGALTAKAGGVGAGIASSFVNGAMQLVTLLTGAFSNFVTELSGVYTGLSERSSIGKALMGSAGASGAGMVATGGALMSPAALLAPLVGISAALLAAGSAMAAAMKETEAYGKMQEKVQQIFSKLVTAMEPVVESMYPLIGLLDAWVDVLVTLVPGFSIAMETVVSVLFKTFQTAGMIVNTGVFLVSGALTALAVAAFNTSAFFKTMMGDLQGAARDRQAARDASKAHHELTQAIGDFAALTFEMADARGREIELIQEGNRARNEELLNLSGRRIRGARWRSSGGIA